MMRCGFWETDVTPPLGGSMFGYLAERIAREIVTKLYAKAAVLEHNGEMVAFLVIDALRVPKGLEDVVRERVFKEIGIPAERILIAATHCHTSMPVVVGREPYQNPKLDQQILDMTALLAADTVIMAYKRMQPAYLRFGIGHTEGISQVREHWMKNGTVMTNPFNHMDELVKAYSEPDTEFPVFFFTDSEGRPLGSITSYAMHHCATGLIEEISADYSYYVSENLKKSFGSHYVSLFYSGFCGNINHYNMYGPSIGESPELGDALTKVLLYTIAKSEPVTEPELTVKMDTVTIKKRELDPDFIESVKEVLKNPEPTDCIRSIEFPYSDYMKYSRGDRVLSRYEKDKRTEYDVPVQVIKIGDCMIYALPFEMFSQFGEKIRAGSPTQKNLLVELAHSSDLFGYIVVPELYDMPTVYEATIYNDYMEIDAGDMMVEKALELAHTL